jgi:hypothetical protein
MPAYVKPAHGKSGKSEPVSSLTYEAIGAGRNETSAAPHERGAEHDRREERAHDADEHLLVSHGERQQLEECEAHADVLEHVHLEPLAHRACVEVQETRERQRRHVERVADDQQPAVTAEALGEAVAPRRVRLPAAERRVPEGQTRREEEHRRRVAVHEVVVPEPALGLVARVEQRREHVPLDHEQHRHEAEQVERQPAAALLLRRALRGVRHVRAQRALHWGLGGRMSHGTDGRANPGVRSGGCATERREAADSRQRPLGPSGLGGISAPRGAPRPDAPDPRRAHGRSPR